MASAWQHQGMAAEARIPCPVCTAPIHPVAGRCKHCREDVRGFRSARPAAPVALPRLTPVPAAPAPVYAPPPEAAAPADVIRHAPPAMPRGYAPPPSELEARSILPPRTTGSQHIADPDGPSGSAWRNWPVVVIVLACVAILGAVVVMVWPQSRPSARASPPSPPPPAPDHMETNPLPPTPDPAPPARPAPPAHTAPLPSTAPDPWNDQRTQADPIHSIDLLTAALQHFCKGRASCPDGDPIMDAACTAVANEQVTPPSCPASDRCLARFDKMSCTDPTDMAGIQALMSTIDDCAEATRC
jgi:hypothetical protein